jgi:hypothetical protein
MKRIHAERNLNDKTNRNTNRQNKIQRGKNGKWLLVVSDEKCREESTIVFFIDEPTIFRTHVDVDVVVVVRKVV